jgi:thiosulfate dehydrogenase
MKSYLAYFSWLSQRAPIGAKLQGAGFDTLPDLAIAPDFGRGAQIYSDYCAACHGASGEGLTQADADGWVFPPLWGPNSYNWGAGMHQTDKASAFIKKNTPIGLKNLLTDQQAWDVATYINSQERPQDPRFTGDVNKDGQDLS